MWHTAGMVAKEAVQVEPGTQVMYREGKWCMGGEVVCVWHGSVQVVEAGRQAEHRRQKGQGG